MNKCVASSLDNALYSVNIEHPWSTDNKKDRKLLIKYSKTSYTISDT